MRLDALGERLSTVAGISRSDFRFGEMPGRGGATLVAVPMHDLSLGDLQPPARPPRRATSRPQSDLYGVLDSQLLRTTRVKQKLTADRAAGDIGAGTRRASAGGSIRSPARWRCTRASTSSPRPARRSSRRRPASSSPPSFSTPYGNMVEIDHGGDLLTRYAHASQAARQGRATLVRSGEKIAEVGNTGRSTGSAPALRGPPQGRGAESGRVPAVAAPASRLPSGSFTAFLARALVGRAGAAEPKERR